MAIIAQHLLALVLVMFGAGCADDMPVTARYVPADCPPGAADPGPETPDAEREPPPRSEVVQTDPAPETESEAEPAANGSKRVNLNSASAAALTTLPGVGPALAARIIAYREKRAFERPEDLLRVRGIGPAKFAKLQDAITAGKAAQKRTP